MYITVLDFGDGLVYQYDIDIALAHESVTCLLGRIAQTIEEGELDFEKIIIEQGHRLDNCEWMTHSDDTLNKIKIEL